MLQRQLDQNFLHTFNSGRNRKFRETSCACPALSGLNIFDFLALFTEKDMRGFICVPNSLCSVNYNATLFMVVSDFVRVLPLVLLCSQWFLLSVSVMPST